MATLSNVSDTSATIDTGFSYTSYTDALLDAAYSITDSAYTIAYNDPDAWDFPATQSWAEWWDGTALYATLSSWGAGSATLSDFALYSPDGAWLTGEGGGKVQYDAYGEITSISSFSMKELGMGNDSASLILAGSMNFNFDAGTVSGKLSALTMGWQDDDPYTSGVEWRYVTLKGSVSLGGDVLSGNPTLSGKVTGIEWGTALANGSLTWTPSGSASGLTLDAGSAMNALTSSGFAGLSAGLYAGNDTIDGTAGDDLLEAWTGNDKVGGREGNDYIDGGAGNDQLTGGAGDDYIVGGAGNDKITDDSGDNIVIDSEGNAQITTGGGSDLILTGAGNDKIVAGDGANDIDTGAGNDNVLSGSGDDFIYAGYGNDKVSAGEGDNWVEGGAGNDVLGTGAGNDVILGGDGADKINGGAGDDVFVFDNLAAGGKDTINDFDVADDFLAFDTDVFTALAGGITVDNLVIGKTALDANDFLVFDTQGGKLYYDADGSGGQSAVQIAIVKGSVSGLSSSHFADADSLLV